MTRITARFMRKLDNVTAIHLKRGFALPKVEENCILVTYTHLGEAPNEAIRFVEMNKEYVTCIVGFGDKMWGADRYCRGARTIAEKYNIPYVRSIERSGTRDDLKFMNALAKQDNFKGQTTF